MSASATQRKNVGRRISRTRIDYRRKRVPKSELTLDWAKVNVELTEKKFQSSRRGVVTLTQLPDQMKT